MSGEGFATFALTSISVVPVHVDADQTDRAGIPLTAKRASPGLCRFRSVQVAW